MALVDWKARAILSYILLIVTVAIGISYPRIVLETFYDVRLGGLYFALLIGVVSVTIYSVYQASPSIRERFHKVSISSGQAATIISIILVGVFAWLSYRGRDVFLTSIFVGALGGIVHELATSEGKFMLPKTTVDNDIYLGGLFGLVAGGVAGLVLAQGLGEVEATTRLLSEAFLAGLGLKGFAEAVATKPSAISAATQKTGD